MSDGYPRDRQHAIIDGLRDAIQDLLFAGSTIQDARSPARSRGDDGELVNLAERAYDALLKLAIKGSLPDLGPAADRWLIDLRQDAFDALGAIKAVAARPVDRGPVEH